jgi:hypothetical protein
MNVDFWLGFICGIIAVVIIAGVLVKIGDYHERNQCKACKENRRV